MASKKNIWEIYQDWKDSLPITKKDYFFHIILILDCCLILFKDSYEGLIPYYSFSLAIFSFDFLVVTIWGISFLRRLRKQDDKLEYIFNRWYTVLGLFPFSLFRLFLLLGTIKHILLILKYIQRGIKDRKNFTDREFDVTFHSMFVDSISDAIYLNSLKRVEEVVNRLEFEKITKQIIDKYETQLKLLVKESIQNKSVVGKLETIPLLRGISAQLAEDVTSVILETMEAQTTANITRELNLFILKEMEANVKSLGLDRISAKKE